MAELWDAYNESFQKMESVVLVRGETVPDGIFHLVGEVIVRHIDGTYLLMQRDFKKHLGGLWELTAGGSALRGETPLACAQRELKEETGLSQGSFFELNRITVPQTHSIYVQFLFESNCDKGSVVLQKGETVSYRWVKREELFDTQNGALASPRALETVRRMNL